MSHLREVAISFGLVNNEHFLAFLSETDLNHLSSTDSNKPAAIQDPRVPLEVLHPSWVNWKIGQLSKNERAFFEPLREKIFTAGVLPEDMRILILSRLFKSQEDYSLPDRSHVSESRLAVLLDKPRSLFDSLFKCMGCYFLAEGLRKVIAKKEIDKVLNGLDPVSRRYLRKLMFTPKKLTLEAIDVKSLEDHPEALCKRVSDCGKKTFQQLLKAQSEEFRWYFFKRYDVDFANELSYREMDSIEALDRKLVDTWSDIVGVIIKYLETAGD